VALGTDRGLALLQITSVVEDQHPIRIAERVHRVAAHVVADCIGVPDRLAQQPLHRVRRHVSSLLGQLPTRSGVHIGQ
jgi:hypothetical protein